MPSQQCRVPAFADAQGFMPEMKTPLIPYLPRTVQSQGPLRVKWYPTRCGIDL